MAAVGSVGRPGVERSRGCWDRAPAFGRVAAGVGRLGLIRFGEHLPKGEYDVDHDGHEGQADAAELHG